MCYIGEDTRSPGGGKQMFLRASEYWKYQLLTNALTHNLYYSFGTRNWITGHQCDPITSTLMLIFAKPNEF